MSTSSASPSQSIIIIYNAESTLRGKLNYVMRKLTSSSGPACAACDITHGGLSLNEVPDWKQTSAAIQARGFRVVQWHRDEVEEDVKRWAKQQEVRYPVVLLKDGATGRDGQGENPNIRLVCDAAELAECAGESSVLLKKLEDKGVLSGNDGSKTAS